MLSPYFGEFLVSPIPLELSLNYCSFGCSYCFANISNRERKTDIQQLMRLLGSYEERTTLTALLLQQKFPVCLSNHVDPFASSNLRQSLPLIELLTGLGIPIQFQTRGAFRDDMAVIDQVLDMLPAPTVWYVTVEVWDDATRKHISPGAPSIPHRLDLVENLSRRGHIPVIGLNPAVPEWLPGDHGEQIIQAAHDRGAQGVWTERLHFSYYQRDAMRPRERQAIGDSLIKRAMQRRTAAPDALIVKQVRDAACALGMPFYSIGQPNQSDFFAPYHAAYPKTFLTMQDFINACHAAGVQGQLLPFSVFADFFTAQFPQGTLPIDAYLGAVARNLWHTHKVPAQMTYRQLLAIIYQDMRVKSCPARLPAFAYAAIWDAAAPEGWIQLVDSEGMGFLVFNPDGHPDYYTHVDVDQADLGQLMPADGALDTQAVAA